MEVGLIKTLYGLVGAKNVGGFKNVVRAIAKETPVCKAHFEFDMKDYNRFLEMAQQFGGKEAKLQSDYLRLLTQTYFPEVTAEGNKM